MAETTQELAMRVLEALRDVEGSVTIHRGMLWFEGREPIDLKPDDPRYQLPGMPTDDSEGEEESRRAVDAAAAAGTDAWLTPKKRTAALFTICNEDGSGASEGELIETTEGKYRFWNVRGESSEWDGYEYDSLAAAEEDFRLTILAQGGFCGTFTEVQS